jgi:ankyrin repeat protein
VKWRLPENADGNGNFPLHVAAANNQKYMCEELLVYFNLKIPSSFLKNNHGQTAAHVAVVAKRHRIGPERHFVVKHEKDKRPDPKDTKEKVMKNNDDDDDQDFGLPIIELFWEKNQKNGLHDVLFERDDDGKTCLHVAAENGELIEDLE